MGAARRIFGAALVVCVLWTSGPATAQESYQFIATPTANLIDGQPITYSSTGGVSVDLVSTFFCSSSDLIGCSQLNRASSQRSGVTAAQRWIYNPVTRTTDDCAIADCAIWQVGVDAEPPFFQEIVRWGGSEQLSFASTDHALAVSQLEASAVYATFFDVPAGSAAFAMRCGASAGAVVCGDIGTVVPDFTGSFVGSVPNDQFIEADPTSVDCTDSPCFVAVVVLGPGPSIHAVAGAPDPRFNR